MLLWVVALNRVLTCSSAVQMGVVKGTRNSARCIGAIGNV